MKNISPTFYVGLFCMRSLIIENQYFPTILFYSLILRIDEVFIESKEHFIKRSFRNKMFIPGPNGVQALSIPLESGKTKKPIDKVNVSYAEDWKKQHWHSIQTIYKNAPYFEHYEDQILHLYNQNYSTLFEWQSAVHQFVLKALRIEKKILFTNEYFPQYNEDQWIDARNVLMPMEIGLEGFEHKTYRQIFQDKIGFQPNMSILDAIMCLGPNTVDIL